MSEYINFLFVLGIIISPLIFMILYDMNRIGKVKHLKSILPFTIEFYNTKCIVQLINSFDNYDGDSSFMIVLAIFEHIQNELVKAMKNGEHIVADKLIFLIKKYDVLVDELKDEEIIEQNNYKQVNLFVHDFYFYALKEESLETDQFFKEKICSAKFRENIEKVIKYMKNENNKIEK
jgi:hypothetical protein